MKSMIPVEDRDTHAALQKFLQNLLVQGAVEALMVPMRTPGDAVTPALVSEPALLVMSDPLAPVMPVNAAKMVGKLSIREPRAKVGVVMRSCELRALVELVKLKQASTENLTLIAVDCAGTFEVPVFQKQRASSNGNLWKKLLEAATGNPEAPIPDLRLACRMCEQPTYDGADISIELLRSDLEKGINLSCADEIGKVLGLTPLEANDRTGVLEDLVAARKSVRDAEFAAIRERLGNQESIVGVFDACIRCHNCMSVCPICYCRTCVFKSPVFEHEPMQYIGWAKQKGACRLPTDTMLFHLTRLNHMGVSCVGCGMCTQACPAELPVGTVFRSIGQRLQETFEYVPGRNIEEPLPLITFKEDEWTELGEEQV